MPIPVFLDTDVVVSMLLSRKGAAHLLLSQEKITLFVSDSSKKELTVVCQRLQISSERLKTLLKKFRTVKIKSLTDFRDYVLDINDAHIVAGATAAKAKFLVSYNQKHFKSDLIKSDLDLVVLTPGTFIQYLRSLGKMPENLVE